MIRQMAKIPVERQVLDVLFPRVRAELLREFFCVAAKPRYVRQLEAKTGLALSTVQDELRKLRAIGIIRSYREGKRLFYLSSVHHPLYRTLLNLVRRCEILPRAGTAGLKRPTAPRRKRRRPSLRATPRDRPSSWDLSATRDIGLSGR
jgi:DNA-binding transcriptional ArsR family regulator